jgi:hypothetical protein
VKEMKEAFDHLKHFLSIMEECDPNADRSLQVQRVIERDTACYKLLFQEKKKASIQFLLTSSSRKLLDAISKYLFSA